MPPKVKVTKEDILNAAVAIVRNSGAQTLNARTVAAALNCSTQPVFSNFETMEELRLAVVKEADALCSEYIRREVEKGEFPAYKASGIAYIRFAKEEKELFKLLYMRDRTNEAAPEAVSFGDEMESFVQNYTGLSREDARMFHLGMWVYVHGLATMVATDFVNLDWDLISRLLSDAYLGMRKQYGME